MPTKDAKKCEKRWKFIQKQGGNKTKWSAFEDEILVGLIKDYGAKEWSNISERLNEIVLKRCHEQKERSPGSSTAAVKPFDLAQYTVRNGK